MFTPDSTRVHRPGRTELASGSESCASDQGAGGSWPSRVSSVTVSGTDHPVEAEIDLGDFIDSTLWSGPNDTVRALYPCDQDPGRGADTDVWHHVFSETNSTGRDPSTVSSNTQGDGSDNSAIVTWQSHIPGTGAPDEPAPGLDDTPPAPRGSLAAATLAATGFQGPLRKSNLTSRNPRKSSANARKVTTSFAMKDCISTFAANEARQPRTAQKRREVALTRKIGACLGCRLWRVPCKRPYGAAQVCEQCHARGSATSPHLCFILNLSDCFVFRIGSPLHDKPPAEMNWITKAEIELEVRMTGAIESRPMKIKCSHFRPADADFVRKNVAGSVAGEFVEVPTYAAVDLDDLGYCVEGTAKYYRRFFLDETTKAAFGFRQQVLCHILTVASAHAARNPGSLVDLSMSIWTGTRLNQMERALVGDEILGMTPIDDHASPIHNLIPIPPVLDNQIDRMTIIWMERVIQLVLKRLGSKVSAKTSGNWFELFLAIMVLLITAEYTAKEQEVFISEFATAGDSLKQKVTEWSWRLIDQLQWSSRRLAYTFRKIAKNAFPANATSLQTAIYSLGLQPDQAELMRVLLKLKGTYNDTTQLDLSRVEQSSDRTQNLHRPLLSLP